MAYSNGYNITTVLAALFSRLGWSTDATLNTANKTSNSGRYFDDGSFHSLVTVTNIKATTPEPVSPATWDTIFTAKQNALISRCLNSVFNGEEFKEQVFLYEREWEQESLVTNSGLAVGYKIDVPYDMDISVKINSLELYFNEAATFNVYLFKQGSKTAVQTKSVTTLANIRTTVALTDWILNRKESHTYWVVYFQNDLGTAKAIQEIVEWKRTFCFGAESFISSTSGTDFNRVSPAMTFQPYGLNMLVTSFQDFSQNIINQPALFDELLGLTMAYQVIEDIVYSVQSDKTERVLKDQLAKVGMQMDLNGAAPISDSPQVIGLRQRIERETKRVKNAFYPNPKAQTVNFAEC
jgi:hypothetical protein